MKKFFRTRLRIVTDSYRGYEAQFRFWWMPFYIQGQTNTHYSLEKAIAFAEKRQKKVVKYL